MLSLKSISFFVNQEVIYNNISITFLPGSIIHLNGKNGSGKTSLLKMIAGIQQASNGSITYGKKSIPINYFRKPYCLYVGHNHGFKEELSVMDNLKYWSSLYDSTELLDAALVYFGLQIYRNKKYYQLSAGNQKKAVLAKLIACQSKIWLLDEVDNSLDKKNNELLANLMISHANNGGVIIFSSHNRPKIKTIISINMSDYVL